MMTDLEVRNLMLWNLYWWKMVEIKSTIGHRTAKSIKFLIY
jgi:hypothetical protein